MKDHEARGEGGQRRARRLGLRVRSEGSDRRNVLICEFSSFGKGPLRFLVSKRGTTEGPSREELVFSMMEAPIKRCERVNPANMLHASCKSLPGALGPDSF